MNAVAMITLTESQNIKYEVKVILQLLKYIPDTKKFASIDYYVWYATSLKSG